MIKLIIFALFIAISNVFGACVNHVDRDRLVKIDSLIDKDPLTGDDSLKAVNIDGMNVNDKILYNLLLIKVADKNYVRHRNDSLIRIVLDYYSKRKDDPYYAEALYYGGRVYSDLGDYPTAIKYYQRALDGLDPYQEDINLKGRILSQTGRLLDRLRLYDPAAYYVREAIKVNAMEHDTVNMAFDHELLGSILLMSDKYDSAAYHLKEAYKLAMNQTDDQKAGIKIQLACLYKNTCIIDSALFYVRHTPDEVCADSRAFALANAAVIYKKAGILDTAYSYARELISIKGSLDRRFGYIVLSEPPLNARIPEDSISQFYADFREEMLRYYDATAVSAARYQNTAYNYELHERARREAEKRGERFKLVTLLLAVCVLVALCMIIWLRMRSKIREMAYSKVLYNVLLITQQMGNPALLGSNPGKSIGAPSVRNDKDAAESTPRLFPLPVKSTVDELREQHRQSLLALCESGNIRPLVPDDPIFNTSSYKSLEDSIQLGKMIPENDPFWLRLRDDITEVSPMFFDRLQSLTTERLKTKDHQTAMLIRCGISPGNMCVIFSRGKGSISQRRETLNRKLFDRKVDYKMMDMIIQSL